MDLKLWRSLQQASGDQVNHQSPLPRGMPWGKQPARGHCNTHVLPWEPAYFLLEKSNRSHSLTACYLPAGGWNYVVNSKRFPSSLTHHPPNRMQNMVCRTGTLRLQRERSDEVMQSTPVSQCRIPPAASVIAQVVKATGSGAILDPPAGVQKHHCPQRTPTSLMHVLAFTRKDGRVCSVGISPTPSRFPESAPPGAKNSSCPNVPVPPPQSPCTLLQFTILSTFPQAAASRTKREKCLCFHHSPGAGVSGKG